MKLILKLTNFFKWTLELFVYYYKSFLSYLYTAIFLRRSSKYLGGDLSNKSRYRDFIELLVLDHNRNNLNKTLSFLGKIRRKLNLIFSNSRALYDLKDIILSKTEVDAVNKIQKLYGDNLEKIHKLSLTDIALHEYAFLELGLFVEAAKCHIIFLEKKSRTKGLLRVLDDQRLIAKLELDTIKLNDRKVKNYQTSKHKDLSFYSRLVNAKNNSDHIRYSLNKDTITMSFYKSICKSKVLIIGPRPKIEELDSVDEFDVIVVMNYHGPAHQRDEILRYFMNKKKVIIVSYFGNNASELLSAPERTVTWDFKPDFIVTKSNFFKFQRDMLNTQNARTLYPVDNILALGSGNFLQQCLYDILCFDPELIKIIGLDFWVGESLYDGGYKINKSDEKFPRYSFAAHNVFSNWLFPKALKQAGLIECSDVVGNALDLNYFEYAEALSQQYPFQRLV